MSADTKLICGLRTNQQVTLVVTGEPGELAPDLTIKTKGQANDLVIGYRSNAWTATLHAGDHVVQMEAPGPRWFNGALQMTLTAQSLIVILGSEASPKPMAWTATEAVNSPKNPWPSPRLAEPLVNPAWFGEVLAPFDGSPVSRSGRDTGSPPPPPARSI